MTLTPAPRPFGVRPRRIPRLGLHHRGPRLGLLCATVVSAAASLLAPAPALATPITYTLSGATATFTSPAGTITLTGTFTFDPAGPTLDAVSITATGPTTILTTSPELYNVVGLSSFPSQEITALVMNSPTETLTIDFANPLTQAPDPWVKSSSATPPQRVEAIPQSRSPDQPSHEHPRASQSHSAGRSSGPLSVRPPSDPARLSGSPGRVTRPAARSANPPLAPGTPSLDVGPERGGVFRPHPLLLIKPGRTVDEVGQGAPREGEAVGGKVVT